LSTGHRTKTKKTPEKLRVNPVAHERKAVFVSYMTSAVLLIGKSGNNRVGDRGKKTNLRKREHVHF